MYLCFNVRNLMVMTIQTEKKNKLYSRKALVSRRKGSWELQCANSSKLILLLNQVVSTVDSHST